MNRLKLCLMIGILICGFAVPAMAETFLIPSDDTSQIDCAYLNSQNDVFPTITSNYGFKIDEISTAPSSLVPLGTYYLKTGTQNGVPTELTGGAPEDLIRYVEITKSVANTFDWKATITVDAVIVKAQGSNIYVYIPASTADKDLQAPNNKEISNIQFCYGSSPYPPPPNVPEFPTLALPVGMLIGFVGLVYTIKSREN